MKRRLLGLALPAVVPVAAVGLLALTGTLDPPPVPGLPDPGTITTLGLPITQSLRDMGVLLTVGALVLAATCAPPQADSNPTLVLGGRRRLLDLVALAASIWFWSSLALIGLAYSDALGVAVSEPGFLTQVTYFGRSYEIGQYLLVDATIAALVATTALGARTIGTVGVLTVLALAGLWPLALGGHAAGTLDHATAVNLQLVHWVGIAVWAGGLGALATSHPKLGDGLVPTTHRFSRLAGWCLAAVAVSGALGALLRVDGLTSLMSAYGLVVGVKVAALACLAALGGWQRRVGLRRLESGKPRGLLRVVMVEIVVIGVAAGAGVALSRTPLPQNADPTALTPAQSQLGYDLPPRLGAYEWFTQWRPDALWLLVAGGLMLWYIAAVARLRARGDGWPWGRTIAWCFGWALFIWATSGSPGAYGRVLFSMHMVQHMTIALAVPTFLVMGAPVTLALRSLRRRTDGSLGPREWVLRVVHSLPARLLGSPIVAAGLVIVSLVAFYYSSLFAVSLRTHTGHAFMTMHFLIVGYLFANCLIGVDPGPRRPAYPLRVLMVLVVFGFHALFSVSLMASERVLARDWYAALDRPWGQSLVDDQYLGASLGWALGDYPLAILAGGLIVSWVRADQRERRRLDRQADRDGDRELTDYNAYLSRLHGSGVVTTEATRREGVDETREPQGPGSAPG